MNDNSDEKIILRWFLNDFDNDKKASVISKYHNLLNPNEFLSDKIKNYSLFDAERDINEKLPLYLIALAETRKSFGNSVTVYKLKSDVIDKIKNTKIDKMPDEVPGLFQKPFIIESTGNETLFSDIDSIVVFFSPMNDDLLKIYKNNPNDLPEWLNQ